MKKHAFTLRDDRQSVGSTDLLRLIAAQSHTLPYDASVDPWFPEVPFLDLDDTLLSDTHHDIVLAVIRAISFREVLEVDYVSRRRTQILTISPHHLMKFRSGFYVRALVEDGGNAKGVTLKLTRMSNPVRLPGRSAFRSEMDTEMELCTLTFTPSPGLNQEIRAMLDAENRLTENGARVVTVPKAFSKFVIRDMTRPRKLDDGIISEAPHWVLDKLEEIYR